MKSVKIFNKDTGQILAKVYLNNNINIEERLFYDNNKRLIRKEIYGIDNYSNDVIYKDYIYYTYNNGIRKSSEPYRIYA